MRELLNMLTIASIMVFGWALGSKIANHYHPMLGVIVFIASLLLSLLVALKMVNKKRRD